MRKDKRRSSRGLYPWLLWLLNGHVTSKNLAGQETCWMGRVGFKYSSNGENPDLEINTSEDRVLPPFFHKMMYRVLTSKSKHIESNVCFKSLKKHSSYIIFAALKNLGSFWIDVFPKEQCSKSSERKQKRLFHHMFWFVSINQSHNQSILTWKNYFLTHTDHQLMFLFFLKGHTRQYKLLQREHSRTEPENQCSLSSYQSTTLERMAMSSNGIPWLFVERR